MAVSTEPRQLSLTINALTIALQAWGNPDNPPILALHGWLDNSASFSYLAPLLKDYYVVAIDMPGHGHSDHIAPSAHYHFIDTIAFVDDVILALDWHRPILLGHSLGACVASMYAGILPDRLRQLVLIEGLGPLSSPADSAPEQLTRYALQRRKQQLNKPPTAYASLNQAAQARQRHGNLSFEAAYCLAERGSQKVAEDTYRWRHDKRLYRASPLRMTEQQALAVLKHITAPSLLIMGADSPSQRTAALTTRSQVITTQLEIVTLTGGHHLHIDHAPSVAQAIDQFLGH